MEQWHRHSVGSCENPKTPDSSCYSETGWNSLQNLTAPRQAFHDAAFERLTSIDREPDRWFVSAGVRTKAGVADLSIGAYLGRIEGQDEVSAALGLQYDVARGLSANLGINHAKADVTVEEATFMHVDETEAVVSIRYSF